MRRKIWLPLFLGILVGACGGNVRLTQHEISPVYKASEFAYAGAGRDLRVVVAGNPFSGDHAEFEHAVTGYMQGNHWGQATNFTTTPGESARENYHVVMLFNPPKTFPGMKLCREKPADLPSEARDDGVVLFAAFCRRNESLTEIKGDIGAASGPADPNFGDLVAAVTQGLFPPRHRFDDDHGCRRKIRCR
ncbi:MAG: hypothetical protein IMF05_06250 [Proteobacteria bacterium]|nr:hypothetical protein [Pseudomonadota bacterium]